MNDYLEKYWIGWACGIVGAFVTGLFARLGKKFKTMQKKQCALELGVQALLRAQIIHIYNKYIELGEMPIYERDNIDQLCEQYKNLGGNGVIKELVEKLNELPTPKKERG